MQREDLGTDLAKSVCVGECAIGYLEEKQKTDKAHEKAAEEREVSSFVSESSKWKTA